MLTLFWVHVGSESQNATSKLTRRAAYAKLCKGVGCRPCFEWVVCPRPNSNCRVLLAIADSWTLDNWQWAMQQCGDGTMRQTWQWGAVLQCDNAATHRRTMRQCGTAAMRQCSNVARRHCGNSGQLGQWDPVANGGQLKCGRVGNMQCAMQQVGNGAMRQCGKMG